MSTTLTEIVRDMVFNSGVPAKAIASDLRKSYTTLLRELNPEDDGCKLGADLLGQLMTKCESISPLRFLAAEMGHRIIPMSNVEPDKSTLPEELNDDLQAVAGYHKAIMDGAGLEEVNAKLQLAILELEENFVMYRRERVRKAG